jgi:pyruvate dehydrogenase E1 component alpha subunit
VQTARDRASAGQGPSLVEAKTYRTVDHAENLPSQPYRPEEEVESWRKRDPLTSFRGRLLQAGVAAGELDKIEQEVGEEVAAAVKFASDSPFPEPTALWEHMYADQSLNRPAASLSWP